MQQFANIMRIGSAIGSEPAHGQNKKYYGDDEESLHATG
jgi:hypothetical protein